MILKIFSVLIHGALAYEQVARLLTKPEYSYLVTLLQEECAKKSGYHDGGEVETKKSADEKAVLDNSSRAFVRQVFNDANLLNYMFDYQGSDRGFFEHRYGNIYRNLFAKERCSTVRILEIGIGSVSRVVPVNMASVEIPVKKNNSTRSYLPGPSLRVWRDYFPKAQIVGWDVDRDVVERVNLEHSVDTLNVDGEESNWTAKSRIQAYVVNSYDRFQVESFFSDSLQASKDNGFDIIIDDGFHSKLAQIATFAFLYSYLRGVYVMEDMTEPFKHPGIAMHDVANFLREKLDTSKTEFFVATVGKNSAVAVAEKVRDHDRDKKNYMVNQLDIKNAHKVSNMGFNMGIDPRFCFNSLDFGDALIQSLPTETPFKIRSDYSIVDLLESGLDRKNWRSASALRRTDVFTLKSTAEDVLRSEFPDEKSFYEVAYAGNTSAVLDGMATGLVQAYHRTYENCCVDNAINTKIDAPDDIRIAGRNLSRLQCFVAKDKPFTRGVADFMSDPNSWLSIYYLTAVCCVPITVDRTYNLEKRDSG